MQLGRSPVSIAELMRAQLLRAGDELSMRNSDAKAYLTDKGTIRLGDRDYASPSTAAKAARGGTSTNGWKAWFVVSENVPVTLADLRVQFVNAK